MSRPFSDISPSPMSEAAPSVETATGARPAVDAEGGDEMERDTPRVPGDDPEVSSDHDPESLEIDPAEAAEIKRQIALEVETFEGGIQG